MARTLEGNTIMWPYTDEEADYLAFPQKESGPKQWDRSGWYWERYKDKCLNELAPLEDLTETEQPFRFAA